MSHRLAAFLGLTVYLTGVAIAYVGAVLLDTGREVARCGTAIAPNGPRCTEIHPDIGVNDNEDEV